MVTQKAYKCGDRVCTDAELDQLEAIKAGTVAVVGGDTPEVVMDKLSAKVNEIASTMNTMPEGMNDVCARFPELCNQVEMLASEKHQHPVVDEHLFTVLESCPECSPRVRDRLLPYFAEKYGFTLTAKEPEGNGGETKEAEAEAEAADAIEAEAHDHTHEGEGEGKPEGEGKVDESNVAAFLS